MEDYFKKILQAKVYEVAKKTPLEKAKNLSKTLNNNIFLKREDLQDVFSFKIRGAYNKMRKLAKSQLSNGVITSRVRGIPQCECQSQSCRQFQRTRAPEFQSWWA